MRQVAARTTAMAAAVLAATWCGAAYLEDVPQAVRQPDGTVLHLLATGDEHLSWLHDEVGFLIVRDPGDGRLVYAVREGDRVRPSRLVVGRDDPAAAGIAPGLRPEPGEAVARALARRRAEVSTQAAPGVPTFSAIENVVVFIRFADEAEFTQTRSLAHYDALFNAEGDGAVSMRSYFHSASYGQLSVRTSFFPVGGGGYVTSFQAAQPRAHYMPYDATTNPAGYEGESQRETREKDLLAAAVAAIGAEVPSSLAVDGNGDGAVDNVCFIVSGTPTAWSTLLWPHMWSLAGHGATINGKRVESFNFQLESMVQVGVLCHEMTHTLGAPDLYHYTSDGMTPVGRWDLMASTTTPPQQVNAYFKYRYLGWIKELPAITTSGTYALAPLAAGPHCYKVVSPNAPREYFLLEYRSQSGAFDSTLPGSGLVVYRINTGVQGNAGGPPDGVYVFRPGGGADSNGSIRDAALGSHVGRTAIDGTTDPYAFLTWGDLGGLSISDIAAPGETVAFTVTVQGACSLGGFKLLGPESPAYGTPLDLVWSAAAGATSYDLLLGEATELPVAATTATPGASVAVAPGAVYEWRVIAANACGRLASGPAWALHVDPHVPALARGPATSAIASATAGDWRYFAVEVPAGARALSVSTAGGSGDVDLYLRRGAFPTVSRNDCAAVRAGNQERCAVASPAPGTWYVGVFTYAPFAGVELAADWALPPRRRLRQ
jgi:M6 family metalloprotease-like protein